MPALTQEDVNRVFKVWKIMFPFPVRTEDEFKVLERSYFISLAKRMGVDEFFLCAEKAQCSSGGFLPSLDKIMVYKDESIAEISRKRGLKALPADTRKRMSNKESEIGSAALAKMREISQMNLTPEEMKAKMEEYLCQNNAKT